MKSRDFPNQFPLNGVDYFLLMLDEVMLRSSGWSNVCRFAIELNTNIDSAELENLLHNNNFYRKLVSLRLKQPGFFILPRWQVASDSELPVIRVFTAKNLEDIPDKCFEKILDPKTDSPLRVDLVRYESGSTCLLLTWHHSLMDAHGAEMLFNHLGGNIPFDPSISTNLRELSWEKLLEFRGQISEISKLPLESLFKRTVSGPVIRNRVIAFSEEETKILDEKSTLSGAVFNKSLFLLATSARAMHAVCSQRGNSAEDFFIPVPRDMRKRGAQGLMLNNQVTFLFYRIRKDTLSKIDAAVKDLTSQLVDMMRDEIPDCYRVMLEYARRLPPYFYRRMLNSTAGGQMASFFFSDTGNSLRYFTHFSGREIKQAVHFPPNMYPPGITLVYSTFRSRTNVTVSYMADVLKEDEAEYFIFRLKHELLYI